MKKLLFLGVSLSITLFATHPSDELNPYIELQKAYRAGDAPTTQEVSGSYEYVVFSENDNELQLKTISCSNKKLLPWGSNKVIFCTFEGRAYQTKVYYNQICFAKGYLSYCFRKYVSEKGRKHILLQIYNMAGTKSELFYGFRHKGEEE